MHLHESRVSPRDRMFLLLWLLLVVSHFNMMHAYIQYMVSVDRQNFSVVQDILTNTSLKNVGFQCVFSVFIPLLAADLWLDDAC